MLKTTQWIERVHLINEYDSEWCTSLRCALILHVHVNQHYYLITTCKLNTIGTFFYRIICRLFPMMHQEISSFWGNRWQRTYCEFSELSLEFSQLYFVKDVAITLWSCLHEIYFENWYICLYPYFLGHPVYKYKYNKLCWLKSPSLI